MPQPRKPASTLSVVGAYKKNPARQRADVQAEGDIGSWQVGSVDPEQVWAELCDIAPRGVLRAADRPALQMAVHLLVQARTNPATLTAARVTALTGLLGKLGMTPAGRLALSVPDSATAAVNPTELDDRLNPRKLGYYRLSAADRAKLAKDLGVDA